MTAPRHARSVLAALLLVTALGACEWMPLIGPGPQVGTVEVTPSSVTFTALEETRSVSATALDDEGETIDDVDFRWSVGDPSVASVDDEGVVTAVGTGRTRVAATADRVTGGATVTVTQEVSELALSPDTATLELVGDTQRLEAEAFDANGNPVRDVEVRWTVGDSMVARVSPSGLTTARRAGTTEVVGSADSRSDTILVTNRARGVDAPSGAALRDELPAIRFLEPDTSEFSRFEDGVLISTQYLMVGFPRGSDVGRANAVLQEHDASVVGATPPGPVVYVRVPDRSVQEASRLAEELRDDPRVSDAALDVGGWRNQALPPKPRMAGGSMEPAEFEGWDWADPASASWGLQRIRAPQMWNLRDAVSRLSSSEKGLHSCVFIVERGFPDASHPDLELTFGGLSQYVDGGLQTGSQELHATGTASVAGALWSNAAGMVGVDPWLDELGARYVLLASQLYAAVSEILLTPPGYEAADNCRSTVLSFSMAYQQGGWLEPVVDAVVPLPRAETSATFRLIDALLNDPENPAPVQHAFYLVGAAGNQGSESPRNVFVSPIVQGAANAASAQDVRPRYYGVEASGRDSARWQAGDKASNRLPPGVGVTAPGEEVGAAVPTDVVGNLLYHDISGTSFSTPLVAGVISALQQGLHLAGVPRQRRIEATRELLTDTRYSARVEETDARRIDAFAAMTGIDGLDAVSGLPIQTALVNVDDGTSDGNLRVDPFSGAEQSGRARGGEEGRVGMADFRRFRDAFLQVHRDTLSGEPADVLLDGGEDHVRKDLNRDGCVEDQPIRTGFASDQCARGPLDDDPDHYPENLFPRFDLNGSGDIELGGDQTDPPAMAVTPYRVNPSAGCTGSSRVNGTRGCFTDLMVMATPEVWDGSEDDDAEGSEKVSVEDVEQGLSACSDPPAGWTTTDLMADRDDDGVIDYMRSFDLHVRLEADARDLSDPGDDLLHATLRPGGPAPEPFPDFTPGGFLLRNGPAAGGGTFVKCRTTAVENTVTVPVLSAEEDTTKAIYHRREGAEDDSDNRYLELELTPRLGEDFALRLAPGSDDMTLESTARGQGTEFLDGREVLWRDRADPATSGGAYVNSQCYADPSGSAHGDGKLHDVMTDLARETFVEDDGAEPASLLRAWVGPENVEVTDPIVARVSRVSFRLEAVGIQPGGCALDLGTLYCWDGIPALPDASDPAEVNSPREVQTDLRFSSFSVGGRARVCAMGADDGLAYCWGANGSGQVGDGTTTFRDAPTEVAGQDSVDLTSVRAGGLHGCGVAASGDAWCWGAGGSGQLGDGGGTDASSPVRVAGDREWRQVAAAGFYTCGVTTGGDAYCWGDGALGVGDADAASDTPVAVAGDHDFEQVAVSEGHACGVRTDGHVLCWGRNGSGQIGDGTTTRRPAPTEVQGIDDARQVTAGGGHTCAVTEEDEALCWGANGGGQLGTGAGGGTELTPVAVTGGQEWGALTARAGLTCGTSLENEGYCWGSPGNQLGDGEDHSGHTHAHPSPRRIAPASRDCPDGQTAGRLWGAWLEVTGMP